MAGMLPIFACKVSNFRRSFFRQQAAEIHGRGARSESIFSHSGLPSSRRKVQRHGPGLRFAAFCRNAAGESSCNNFCGARRGMSMRYHMQLITALLGIAPLAGIVAAPAPPGTDAPHVSEYRVLSPLHQGNLAVFPVVSDVSHDTSEFITLDEGVRSGAVVVSEAGNIRALIRRGGRPFPVDGARVNQLVLVNNSDKPLLLLAGEIVTGGKQDRVVGKDRIVPAQSDPVELGVFCVEPGRWTGASSQFNSLGAAMAQPSVRAKAMVDKNQQAVWDQVYSSRETVAAAVPDAIASGAGGGSYRSSTSYAQMIENKEVQKKVDEVAVPVQRNYSKLIRELRSKNAVGVVVVVNGEIVWADIFASTSLLEKYWPKLVRS